MIFFLWLPMYWAYLKFESSGNLRIWHIVVLPLVVRELLMDFLVDSVSRFSCSFVMNVQRLWMAPSCVPIGRLASQYGVGWAMCICGVLFGFYFWCPLIG